MQNKQSHAASLQRWLQVAASACVLIATAATLSACVSAPMRSAGSDRLDKANALFADRCSTAGERVTRTVEGIDGVVLLKVRPKGDFHAQFHLDDPYGWDYYDDLYIKSFLRGFHHQRSDPPHPESAPRIGYSFVIAKGADGVVYRYTAKVEPVGRKDATAPGVLREIARNPNYDLNIYDFVLRKERNEGPLPKYGVTYDDISTRQDREHWIAGSSLKVVDLGTNEVIAERIGFMMDVGQGSTRGGRAPWFFAASNACPGFWRNWSAKPYHAYPSAQLGQTLIFVEKALVPKQ